MIPRLGDIRFVLLVVPPKFVVETEFKGLRGYRIFDTLEEARGFYHRRIDKDFELYKTWLADAEAFKQTESYTANLAELEDPNDA